MSPFSKIKIKNTLPCFLFFLILMSLSCGCTVFGTKTYILAENIKPDKATEKMLGNSNKQHFYHFMQCELSKKKGNFKNAILHINKALETDPDSFFLKKELIKLYIYTDQTPKALKSVEDQLKNDPNNIEILIILSQIKLTQNKDIEVPEIYKKIITIDPNQQAIYFLLGGIYSKLNQIDKAIAVFTELVKKFPDAVSGYYYLGRLHLIKNNNTEAEKAFNDALKISPEFKEALNELAGLYEKEKMYDKLFITCRKMLKIYPENLRASFTLSLMYNNENRPEKSKALLLNIMEKVPVPQITNGIIKYYLSNKNIKQAVILLDQLLEIEPDNDKFLYLSATCFNQLKDQKKAMAQFRKIQPDSEYYPNAILILAFNSKDKGQNDNAIFILEKAHLNIPDNSDFILYLGTFHEENNDLENALAYYKQGIALNKKLASFHFRAGVIFDKQNKRTQCIAEMKTVIELDPEDTNALNYLGYTYADIGENLDEAEMMIKKALSLKPDDAYITDSLGWLYYKKGDIKKATALLNKAVELVPDDSILLEHLGDAFLKDGNNEKALEFYMRSLNFETKNKKQLLIKINMINQKRKNN